MPSIRSSHAACGTQNAALIAGGADGSYYGYASEYDGSAWSQGGQLGTARHSCVIIGVQTDAVCTGGYPNSNTDSTSCEQYDGTSWQSFDALTTSRNNNMADT